jgi:ribosomal protein L14
MLISGRWIKSKGGEDWPVVIASVTGATRTLADVPFLIDTGADQTLLCAEVARLLQLSQGRLPHALKGVGSVIESYVVSTEIRLRREDGVDVSFNGPIACCVQPDVLDMSVLGRDILNKFAVIIDNPGHRIALVRERHRYAIESV